MRFGTLHITFPDGRTQEFALDQPAVTAGRASDNVLVLEESSVSRRHARLTIDSGQLYIEDLGSANGTYIGQTRLPPNHASLVAAQEVMRVGDVAVRYTAPAPIPVEEAFIEPAPERRDEVAASAGAPAGPTVSAALVGPTQPLAPGGAITANLTVQNRNTVVDDLAVSVTDLPAEWVRLSQARVPLLPGAQQVVTITIQPPRVPAATAGAHAFSVTVTSAENGSRVTLGGQLQLLPYSALSARLEPVRARRDFTLHIDSQGNTPASLTLGGTDDEKALEFRFSQVTLNLPPGASQAVNFRVAPRRRPSLLARETRSFTVTLSPDARGMTPVVVAGQLMIRPAVPTWLVVLAALLLAAGLCAGGGVTYTVLCPVYAPDLPFCPAAAGPGEVATEPVVTISEPEGPTATQTPRPPATAAPTVPPTRTARPTPNRAVGTFETHFDQESEMVFLAFGPTLGSFATCFHHSITLAPQDVGKTLSVSLLMFDVMQELIDEHPDTRFTPDLGLYRSYTGAWQPEQEIDFWSQPSAEAVLVTTEDLEWVVTQEGDYEICLQMQTNLYDSFAFGYQYARYQVLLSGN